MINIENSVKEYLKVNIEQASDKELLEKQYEKLLEYVIKGNEHRTSLNSFHQTIAAAIVGIITGIYNFNISDTSKYLVIAAICAVGFSLSFIWSQELKRFYRSSQILDAIIAHIEQYLPANPLDARVKVLATLNAPARTEKQEQMIPWALSIAYVIVSTTMMYMFLMNS